MRKGTRVVILATGDRGEIAEPADYVFGERGDLWAERHFAVARDDTDPEAVGYQSVAESGLATEEDYDSEHGDGEDVDLTDPDRQR